MGHIYICPRCGEEYEDGPVGCSICWTDTIDSGINIEEWYKMNLDERTNFKKNNLSQLTQKTKEQIQYEEEQKRIKEERDRVMEVKKREYANSFGEYYEYDVVTIINKDHGTIDRDHMMQVLSDHARQGWKLHSIYSNELGKNAVRILGFGVNSTACEDVLIFERRIERIEAEVE